MASSEKIVITANLSEQNKTDNKFEPPLVLSNDKKDNNYTASDDAEISKIRHELANIQEPEHKLQKEETTARGFSELEQAKNGLRTLNFIRKNRGLGMSAFCASEMAQNWFRGHFVPAAEVLRWISTPLSNWAYKKTNGEHK